MILLFAFYTLVVTAAKAEDMADPSRDADNYRSLPNIVWSCLTTIFLCTWVSLHPNIPRPIDPFEENKLGWFQRYTRKLGAFLKNQALPFVVLLLAPEWILMWALRQRLTVEWMVQKRQVPTRRHGFFIIMGGFHKFTKVEVSRPAPPDPASTELLIGSDVEKKSMDQEREEPYGKPDHPLDRFDVCRLVDEGKLRLPPEVEVDDKSKSDWIAKSLVLLQTLWFVVQCIARRMDHLPLTELEVVTLGYTLLNLIVYVMWWDKPQKVTRPIRVFCGDFPERNDEQKMLKLQMEAAEWDDKLFNAVLGGQDQLVELRSVKQTPTFYSGHPPLNWPHESMPLELVAMMVTSVIGGAFGAIHFLAWSSEFPTHKMQILWRWASIFMTAAPVPTLFFCFMLPSDDFLEGINNAFLKAIRKWIIVPLFIASGYLSIFVVPLVYIAGRVITFLLAFQTLSSLPPDAFRSVQWTNLFPHI